MDTITRRRLLASALGTSALATVSPLVRAQSASGTGVLLQRLAWAGVKIESSGVAVFIDARAPDAEDDAPGPALATSAERAFALVTHHHGDHCDPVALKSVLGENGYIVAEDAVSRLFDHHDVNVQSVRVYEPVFLSRGRAEFVAWCVPAVDGLGSPQVSWVIDTSGRRILHCGDTAWHGAWWDIARAYGPFDIALLPINGMQQQLGRYTEVSQPMSLTPEQAVSAARILKPRLTIPIHYGAHRNPAYREEPNAEARFVKGMATAGLAIRLLKPGESLTL